MSKIPYPNKNERKEQIQLILDNSGFFDDTTDVKFTEYVPSKTSFVKRMALPVIVAAAAVVIVSAVKFLPNSSHSTGTPMTNSFKDDTIRTASKTMISSDIMVEICTDTWQDSEHLQVTYNYPKIYYQGIELSAVTEYYQQKVREVKLKAQQEYQQKNQDTDISVLYSVSVSSSDSYVTVCETYAKTVKDSDSTVTVNEAYGSNFDVSDGHKITFEELFDDDSAIVSIGEKFTAKAKQENLDLQEIFGTEDAGEIMNSIIQTDSWYMGTDGLVICVNNIPGKEKQYSDESYKNYYSESFIIQQ
jgi:hypothetical protein